MSLLSDLFDIELAGEPTKARLYELAKMANLMQEDSLYQTARYQMAFEKASDREFAHAREAEIYPPPERITMRELWGCR